MLALNRTRSIPTLLIICSRYPQDYKELYDLNGTPYYYHLATKTVTWQHPLDSVYKEKLRGMR